MIKSIRKTNYLGNDGLAILETNNRNHRNVDLKTAQNTTLNGRCKNMHSKSLHSTNQAGLVRINKKLDNLIKKRVHLEMRIHKRIQSNSYK